MATKKACVVHTPSKKAGAETVVSRLRGEDYEVCVAEVSVEIAKDVKAGEMASLPADVRGCLEGADVCVILIDEEVNLGVIGGLASDGGCRVVTIGGSPDNLPAELDDVVDGHLPAPDSPELVDVVSGVPERVRPDNKPAPPREPDRVKCQ